MSAITAIAIASARVAGPEPADLPLDLAGLKDRSRVGGPTSP
jgi:hypothetical protein